jgi:hypothetical protein
MSKREISADCAVDDLYADLRHRHGDRSSRANGYLYEGYFRADQLILFSLLGTDTRRRGVRVRPDGAAAN